jgi:hypothetical protein
MAVTGCCIRDDGDDAYCVQISFDGPIAETDEEAKSLRALNYYTTFGTWIRAAEAELTALGGHSFEHELDGHRGSINISYTVTAAVDRLPAKEQMDAVKLRMDVLLKTLQCD